MGFALPPLSLGHLDRRHNLLIVTDDAEPTSVGLRRIMSEPKAEACKAFNVTTRGFSALV